MEYVGLGSPINLCIVSPFLLKIATVIVGSASALETMDAKQYFHHYVLNTRLIYEH